PSKDCSLCWANAPRQRRLSLCCVIHLTNGRWTSSPLARRYRAPRLSARLGEYQGLLRSLSSLSGGLLLLGGSWQRHAIRSARSLPISAISPKQLSVARSIGALELGRANFAPTARTGRNHAETRHRSAR